jgi:hypothetical protein
VNDTPLEYFSHWWKEMIRVLVGKEDVSNAREIRILEGGRRQMRPSIIKNGALDPGITNQRDSPFGTTKEA